MASLSPWFLGTECLSKGILNLLPGPWTHSIPPCFFWMNACQSRIVTIHLLCRPTFFYNLRFTTRLQKWRQKERKRCHCFEFITLNSTLLEVAPRRVGRAEGARCSIGIPSRGHKACLRVLGERSSCSHTLFCVMNYAYWTKLNYLFWTQLLIQAKIRIRVLIQDSDSILQ